MSSNLSKPKSIESSSSDGYQIEHEKTFEYTISQGEYIKISEMASFPNALSIIVEIDIKCNSGDSKPSFDIILVSKEHCYTKLNSNNNVGSFGTCFIMKLNSIQNGKKYILLGDEIKIMTHPENSYRRRYSSNAKGGRNNKSVLKIKCYPINERSYAAIENGKAKEIDEETKFEMKFLNDVDYYLTLIFKFFIRSLPVSEDEKLLQKDKCLALITKEGLNNPSLKKENVFDISAKQFASTAMISKMKSLMKSVQCGIDSKISSHIESIRTAIKHIESNEIEKCLESMTEIEKIKKHIREIVPLTQESLKVLKVLK